MKKLVSQYRTLREECRAAWAALKEFDPKGDGESKVRWEARRVKIRDQGQRLYRFTQRVRAYRDAVSKKSHAGGREWPYSDQLGCVDRARGSLIFVMLSASDFILSGGYDLHFKVGTKYWEICDLFDAEVNVWAPEAGT